MEIPVNYLAVLLAAIASMALGFFWYSKSLFGAKWAALKGYTDETLKAEQAKMGKYYVVSFVLAILTAYILTHMIFFSHYFFQYPRVQVGLSTAFFAWLGLVMPTQATAAIFGEKKWLLFVIDTGYQLTSLIAMGIVIGLLG